MQKILKLKCGCTASCTTNPQHLDTVDTELYSP